MLFDYKCSGCEIIFEADFPIGKAEKEVPCPECSEPSKRVFTSCSFILKGGGWPGKSGSFNKEMTERNESAGRRMKDNVPPIKTVAHDYGNGDVREVKKGG